VHNVLSAQLKIPAADFRGDQSSDFLSLSITLRNLFTRALIRHILPVESEWKTPAAIIRSGFISVAIANILRHSFWLSCHQPE
jgi:hypothetical protein